MPNFFIDYLGPNDLDGDNSVVHLKDCLTLIEGSEFEDELKEAFEFEKIHDNKIYVKGLSIVLKSVLKRNQQFQKIDLNSHISDITCLGAIDENTIRLRFLNPSDSEYINIEANTVYSAKRDFFNTFYSIDKFAKYCWELNCFELIQGNLEYLNEKFKDSESLVKSFRLLKDSDGDYFLRAITSVRTYKDFNINFSLFVTIISLYRIINQYGYSFEIGGCEFSESNIRLFVVKNDKSDIPDVGQISFVLELTNDEIKRESFKFDALYSISFFNNARSKKILIKPKKILTKLISIKHSLRPETVLKNLNNLASFISKAEEEMKADIVELSKVKRPDCKLPLIRTAS